MATQIKKEAAPKDGLSQRGFRPWGLVDQLLSSRSKSIPDFVPCRAHVDQRPQYAPQGLHGPLQPGVTIPEDWCARLHSFVFVRVQPIVLREVVEVVTILAHQICLSRRTLRKNHVVGEQFDVQVLNDVRTLGRTLRNIYSIDEMLRWY